DPALRLVSLPRLPRVVPVLILLDVDPRLGKQVAAAHVIPVRVRDDHLGDVGRLDAEAAHRLGGFGEIPRLPFLEELLPMEPRIEEDDVPAAAHHPDEHGDVELAILVRAAHQRRDGELRKDGIFDRVHLVLRWRVGTGRQSLEEHRDREEQRVSAHRFPHRTSQWVWGFSFQLGALSRSARSPTRSTGGEKKYPCAEPQPISLTKRSCSAVSTPSATTCFPRSLAKATMVFTNSGACLLGEPPRKSDRSIFSESSWNR